MKKKKLYEAQKNYLTCSILLLIAGALLAFYLGKFAFGIGTMIVGILCLIGFFVLLKKQGLCTVYVDPPENKKAKDTDEEDKKISGEIRRLLPGIRRNNRK